MTIGELSDKMERGFGTMERAFMAIQKDMQGMNAKIQNIDIKVINLDLKFDQIDLRLAAYAGMAMRDREHLDGKINALSKRLDIVEHRLAR